jgi:hypothetical protein
MVDHLDHGRSAAGQAPGREKTPAEVPVASRLPGAKAARNYGASSARKQ